MVGPTGLLCHLRVFRAEHSFLKRCVKPACSQVQTLTSCDIFQMVGPTGLLCHLRVFRAEHSFLKRCVKPACSQVQTLTSCDIFQMVGPTGFEPATPSPPAKGGFLCFMGLAA